MKWEQVDTWWLQAESSHGKIHVGKDRTHFPYGLHDVKPGQGERVLSELREAFEKQREWSKEK